MGYDWDWAAAEASFKQRDRRGRRIRRLPTPIWRSSVRIRKFDESQTEFERSTELDPLSIVANTNIGLVLFSKRDYEAADRRFNKTLEFDDKIGSTHWLLSRSLWQQAKEGRIGTGDRRGLELDGNSSLAAKLKQQVSPQHAVDRLLHEWKDDPSGTNPHNLAYLSMYANDKDRAMYWLERSVNEHHPWTAWIDCRSRVRTSAPTPVFRVSDENEFALIQAGLPACRETKKRGASQPNSRHFYSANKKRPPFQMASSGAFLE